eukprot:c5317_g1_i2.p1 GENE.c5317_g1_i2~~c5317_g1_i2.p1  ORF type:complete len:111 (-),score=14.88 c5317_g1_i2:149-481(-)
MNSPVEAAKARFRFWPAVCLFGVYRILIEGEIPINRDCKLAASSLVVSEIEIIISSGCKVPEVIERSMFGNFGTSRGMQGTQTVSLRNPGPSATLSNLVVQPSNLPSFPK